MKKKRGFTLIEVLASFLIISILSVSITSVIINSINSTNDRRARILATSVAENYINNVKNSMIPEKVKENISGSKIVSVTTSNPEANFNDTNTLTLTSSNCNTLINGGNNSLIFKNLFLETSTPEAVNQYKINLDGEVYDSSKVTIRFGIKRYSEGANNHDIIVVIVNIKYYNNRTMEVARDVY